MKLEILNHRRLNNGGRKREWTVTGNSSESCRFTTPMLFSGISPSGNQINKLAWLYPIWKDKIDLLMSMYDVYCSTAHIEDRLRKEGISRFFKSHLEYLKKSKHVISKQESLDIEKNLSNGSESDSITRPTMLDSGGFSLSSVKGVESAVKSKSMNKNDKDRREFFNKLIRIVRILESGKSLEGYYNDIEFVQTKNLEWQLPLRPTFLLTLDKVIRKHDWPLEKKRAIARFGISCAEQALKYKAMKRDKFNSLLLAVLHPVGPGPKEIVSRYGYREASKKHEIEMFKLLEGLCEAEEKYKCKFDGFAVGSLVPIKNYDYLCVVAEGIAESILKLKLEGRFLHGLGVTNRKMETLVSYGFDSFDTTLHFRHARNRKVYSKNTGQYVTASEDAFRDCKCPLCASVPMEIRLENRAGLKEFATVCQALHNFFVNHQEFVESLGRDS